ncbi:hypothetical protein Clacol_009365 [Clathrus columnatus]|uniref:PIN domain-like protein n=1 Tax=Clathrus columnatus TaxID=1419009 RepID=A0AAV5AKZ6_9AGAM|nr:hypothetical protein Clacol_009365 [Clathrus columnatus]
MGVLGLTPFIQRYCPEVIRELPHRLSSLSGKTLAIDGTLITQRLHFAPMPYASRHVLGWYRLIKELKEAQVGVICVFDGEGRNIAKDSERERRRKVQRMTLARGTIEADRLKRLNRLGFLLKDFRALSQNEQIRWSKVLRRLMVTPGTPTYLKGLDMDISGLTYDVSELPAAFPALRDQCSANLEDIVDLTEQLENVRLTKESTSQAEYEPEPIDFNEALAKPVDSLVDNTPDPIHLDESPYPSNSSYTFGVDYYTQDVSYDVPPSNYGDALAVINPEDSRITDLQGEKYLEEFQGGTRPSQLMRNFISLFRNYETTVPVIMQAPMVELTAPDNLIEGAEEQYAMSKHQLQLTAEEGKLWTSLTDPQSLETVEQTLDALANRSESLTKSYEKRNNPPTYKTYEESKEILRAMGVPCIDAVGPYEAEALAASLVHHGFADYVASEDTDVLIFEVPLLRNITNRQAPLTLVSGAEIRRVLDLDRASFVDFALLLGTDFSQRIKNLGPSRAIKLIRAHRRIENVIAEEPKFIPRQPHNEYLQQVALGRSVFETLPPVPSPDLLKNKETDVNMVIAMLERHRVYRAAMAGREWDYSNALSGNYFNDNPTM